MKVPRETEPFVNFVNLLEYKVVVCGPGGAGKVIAVLLMC